MSDKAEESQSVSSLSEIFSEASIVGRSERPEGRYQYQPLDPPKNEIRLLKIHRTPRSHRDGNCVRCDLLTTSLDTAPSYQALSYTWGSHPNTEDIFLDGHHFKISPNLEAAFQQLRFDRVRLIWIDALCIDQANPMERSEQVSKMRQIYQRADKVLVWLGPSIDQASLAFNLFEDLYKNRNRRDYVCATLQDKKTLPGLEAVRKLLHSDYWIRLWVIQEVNSAKSITILWGKSRIGWKKWKIVQNLLYDDPDYRLIIDRLSIDKPLDRLESLLFTGGPRSLELPPRDSPSELPLLHTLLYKFSVHEASDPRDKIYALVGLSTARNDSSFVIDYSASVRQVYISAVKYIIVSTKRLDAICSMPRGTDEFGLPSWVPNWVYDKYKLARPLVAIMGGKMGSTCKAAGSSTAQFELQNNDQNLITKGIVLSRIQSVGQKARFQSSNDTRTGVSILLNWYSLCNGTETPTLAQMNNFCRTITFDRLSRSNPEEIDGRKPLELREVILESIALVAEEVCPDNITDPYLAGLKGKCRISAWWAQNRVKIICTLIKHRRFFISESELVGIGPDKMEPGDIICILLGCSTPVVLRPQDDKYIFLGEGFVPGYMNGQAMDELAEGKFRLESFEMI